MAEAVYTVSHGVVAMAWSLANIVTPGVPTIDITPNERCGSGRSGTITPQCAPNSARDPREGTHRRLGVERAGVQRAGPVHQRHNSVHRSPHMIHRHDRHSDSLSSTALRFARGGRSSSHHT